MRILMIGLDLNPPWVEGTRNTVRLISQNLIKDNHEVYVLTKGSDDQLNIEFVEGIKYHRINIGHSTNYLSGSFAFLVKLPIKLIKVIKDEKIDIIHGHSVYPVFGIILGICSKITGVKSVFTILSSPSNKKNKALNYPKIMSILNFSKNKSITKILSFFTDVLVVTSNATKRSLTSIGISENKIEYIPVGTDLTVFKPLNRPSEIKTKLNIPSDKKIILSAGDITPWKGLDVFLRAISIVSKKYPNILCTIMTKDIYKYEKKRREEVNDLIKSNNIEKYIYIIGQHDNIQEIYGISDIVVFPFVTLFSVMDTPLSLLEAMAVGKPVIASNVGSFGEVISHLENGLLIEPNNEFELAEAIINLLEKPILCKKISDNALNTITEKYDINICSSKLENLYDELKNKSPRGGIML
jgi:glycosyltransferase involved in cell wall biosynthesis